MAFLGKLFGGMFGGGNTNSITTENVTSIAMSVAVATGTNCGTDQSASVASNITQINTSKTGCSSEINIDGVDVTQTTQVLNMQCLQSAANAMTSSNDISAQVSNALKSVQDGLAHDFDMFASTEQNKIKSSIKQYITNNFSNQTTLSCVSSAKAMLASGIYQAGPCPKLSITKVKLAQSMTAAINCIQQQSGVYEQTNTIRDQINASLSKEVTSFFAWLTDIAKQFAIVAAIAVIIGGVTMLAKGEGPSDVIDAVNGDKDTLYDD